MKLYTKQCYFIYWSVEKNPKVGRTKNGTIMLLSKCAVCNSKKSKFLKEQEAKGILSSLTGIKFPMFSDIPVLNALFQKFSK